ncbi:MAG: DUF2652 domain-containing protein [Deltaproteobacteria bacterium]|nr:DUF2652 domain-containing protein [Deltaproteobacteria bacterium]
MLAPSADPLAIAEDSPLTQLQKVFLVLLDISGYTRFIKFHKVSLIHAERIIDELLERVIAESRPPLVLQELEGDAVFFYAVSDSTREMAQEIVAQVHRSLAAFREREAVLVSECGICTCDACRTVGRLSMKAVVHHGNAVFTQVQQFTKLSGEDVILAHMLLKVPIERREHVLVTESMHALLGDLDEKPAELRTESCGELGQVNVSVYYPSQNQSEIVPARVSFLSKLKMFAKVERHLLKRLVTPATKRYAHIDALRKSH